MLLRARVVLPVTAPPLEDGAVLASGGRIAAVGPWRELRRFARRFPERPPAEVLRHATTHAARALGLAGRRGELAPGADADLIALPYGGAAGAAADHAVAGHDGRVAASLIAGEWAILPPA